MSTVPWTLFTQPLVTARAQANTARTQTAWQARRQQCMRAATADVQQAGDLSPEQLGDVWQSFASTIAGEWSGKSASFERTGDLKPLPERYVPPEYGNWDIVLSDWSTLASVKAEDGLCSITTKHFFPTVGCEADAASFLELTETGHLPASGSTEEVQSPLYVAGGSYSLGPEQIPGGTPSFNIESCFFLNKDQRIRMRVKFDRYLATKPYLAQDIELLSETLEGEFKGGRDLPMCCGYETGFSKQEALGSGAPERAWRAVEGLVYHTCDSGAISARPAGASDTWVSGETAAVCLPLNAWLRLEIADDSFEIEMAIVHPDDADRASIVRRLYKDGSLSSVFVGEAQTV